MMTTLTFLAFEHGFSDSHEKIAQQGEPQASAGLRKDESGSNGAVNVLLEAATRICISVKTFF